MMGKLKDISGMRFGKLVAVRPTGKQTKGRQTIWLCSCDCGNTHEVTSNSLLTNHTKSCGCTYQGVESSVRYGRLTALSPTDRRASGSIVWRFLCDCGREVELPATSVKYGRSQSCGCQRRLDYQDLRLRSKWELYWLLAAEIRGIQPSYEKDVIPLIIDDKPRKYIPDFKLEDGTYVEIKGQMREDDEKKIEAARRAGHTISVLRRADVEAWCGCSVDRMSKAYAEGGVDAVRDHIVVG